MEPENDCAWKPKQGMTFDSEKCVYDFYNTYGGRMGSSIRSDFCRKNKFTNQLICRLLVCNKEGFRKGDKRDRLSKNPRAKTRTGCKARLYVKLDEGTGKYVVTNFKEKHNRDLVSPECAHMLPSQRNISTAQAIELDLAAQSGLRLGQSFELMGREAGGRQCLGFTKLDQKNYLRTKRQQSLAYGEVGNVLQYFKEKSLQNPSFFYAFQLDNEEQITNMFWDDSQMIMDYAQFGDVVTFDTTYKLNKEHRPFSSFVGFNHHRETVIFGAVLLYDETAESFVWLFQNFLEAMSGKAPKTLFTDQDAAMAKAKPIVMPDRSHRLCTWYLMQNALKHVNCLFQDKGVNGVLNKFFFDIEDANQWKLEWAEMFDKYDAHENHWLKLTFAVKKKWGWPYVRSTWAAGMILYEKRYKELEAGYALCQRLPKVKATIRMLIQKGNVYTKKIFEEFQNEYFRSIESDIEAIEYGEASTIYTVVDVGNKHARKVKIERDGSLGCNCTKFEREGILCCHSLKVIRDILKIKEVPPHIEDVAMTEDENGMQSEVIPSQIVKQTHVGLLHKF
ncbi:protein FAR1-RELATED SEQUENCE 5-like [Camellia sinensis]|uniref:protein FAR1-RELATED SEQUENCE 5-like n=1 Tax=Camellia sinensis TaxID=4442 RepID=UPI0010367344|nr:protein FAR1-RELATED SEQUENCE 5-like [Camellia sinensis]